VHDALAQLAPAAIVTTTAATPAASRVDAADGPMLVFQAVLATTGAPLARRSAFGVSIRHACGAA
jgi:hypothetical protein